MKESIIVGIGEILWDVYPEGKVLGGAPANFVYHVSQFGYTGHVISAIGKDINGKDIEETLQKKELRSTLEKTSYPTGIVKVSIDSRGEPNYDICKNVAWDAISFSDEIKKLALKTQTVCFGSLAQRNSNSAKTISQFLDAVPDNAFKVFDINLRQNFYTKKTIDNSLKKCNILKINNEELAILAELFKWQTKTEPQICELLLQLYELKILILTKGRSGSYVFTPAECSFRHTPEVEVVDTVGAGDSFTASFMAALLKQKSIAEAHQLAVDVSSFVCTQKGAMPLLPDSIIDNF